MQCPIAIKRRCSLTLLVLGAAAWTLDLASGQVLPGARTASVPQMSPLALAPAASSPGSGQLVVDVVIEGERSSKDYEIQKHIHTRKDREFDPELLQADVRRLITSGLFRDVRTFTEQAAGGIVVRFKVVERPRIGELKFLGNRGFSDKKLTKEIGLKKGDPLNSYAAEEGRRKIEEVYRTGGYPQATVAIFEGDKQGDQNLVFLINEGQLERIGSVSFAGNTIAPDGVLKTKVQSKPGYFWYLFGGKVDRAKIDADVQTITAYYRSLGYFRARVSRALDYDEAGKWLALTFIIDEGPRYRVRNVAIEGGTKFNTQAIVPFLAIKREGYFNQAEANKDVATLIDLYGSQGHVFADVQADLRFLEEPGVLDIAYRIKEGEVFKVGEINVHIAGEFPHTKQTVVLNRVSVRPGDIIDTREVRNSERRLKASQLFAGTQNDGEPPRIVIRPPDLNSIGGLAIDEPPQTTVRGQQPDLPQPSAVPCGSFHPPPPESIYSWGGRVGAPQLVPPPQPAFYAPPAIVSNVR